MECSVNVHEILLVDDGVEFFHTLGDFLSNFLINFWIVVFKSPNIIVGVSIFSSQFYQFLPHIFCSFVVWYIHI